jgi:hypothetical protein
VFRGLYSVVGVSTYWPYLVLLVVVHLAIVVLLWHVMVRSEIDPWLALGFTAVIAVSGVGLENLTNVWQVQLVSPLALGLGALLLLPDRGRLGPRDGGVALLLTAAMMCSGVALTMLGIVGLVALVRRGWRVALAVVALPAVAYAWWYLAYGRDAPKVADPQYGTVPRYVWDGVTDAVGDLVRLRTLGVVVVLAAVVWLVWQLTRRPVSPAVLVPAVMALGAVASLALTGWRRGAITSPATSRYAYVTLVLVLPLLAMATEWCVRRAARARLRVVVPVVVGVLLLAVVVAQVRMFDRYVVSIEPTKRVEKAALLNAAALAREDHEVLDDHPLSIFEPQVTLAKIARADADGALPSLDGLRETDRLTTLARLELVVAPPALDGVTTDPSRVRLDGARGVDPAAVAGRPDCRELTARPGGRVRLVTSGRVAVGIHGDGRLVLRLTTPAGTERGLAIAAMLDPAASQVLSIGPIDGPHDGGAVELDLPAGSTTVCGVS